MAVYDSNLMLRTAANLTAQETGAWVDLGAGGAPNSGLSFRTVVPDTAGSTPSFVLTLQFADNTATVKEALTQALSAPGDYYHRVSFRRRYARYLAGSVTGTAANFGVVTIGADAGDSQPNR